MSEAEQTQSIYAGTVGDVLDSLRSAIERGDEQQSLKQFYVLARALPRDVEWDFIVQYKKMERKLADAVRLRQNAEALLRLYSGYDLPETQFNKIVCGALKSSINDHGPVTTNLIGSAAKRVVGEIKSYLKGKESGSD